MFEIKDFNDFLRVKQLENPKFVPRLDTLMLERDNRKHLEHHMVALHLSNQLKERGFVEIASKFHLDYI